MSVNERFFRQVSEIRGFLKVYDYKFSLFTPFLLLTHPHFLIIQKYIPLDPNILIHIKHILKSSNILVNLFQALELNNVSLAFQLNH